MADGDLSLDQVRKMAADIGLSHLTDAQMKELQRATLSARARRAALPLDRIATVDEPAHVYRLGLEGGE